MKRPGFQFRLMRNVNSFFTLRNIFSDLTIFVIGKPEKVTGNQHKARTGTTERSVEPVPHALRPVAAGPHEMVICGHSRRFPANLHVLAKR
jgi:hypothetical protein